MSSGINIAYTISNPAGSTVTTTGPAAYNTGYSSTGTQTFTNAGTLDSTGTGAEAADSGIEFYPDAGAGDNSLSNSGLITGYDYGINLRPGGGGASRVVISNTGTIMARRATGGAYDLDSGIYAGGNANVTISNTGMIVGPEGVDLEANDVGVQIVNNLAGGTITGTVEEAGHNYAIKIQDLDGGFKGTADIYNAGLINGYVDVATQFINITNASTGTFSQHILAFGSGTLTLDAGEKILGAGVHFDDVGTTSMASTIVLGGAGTVGTLTDPGDFSGFGSATVTSGADWTLGTATSTLGFGGISTIADFGTIDLAGSLAGNTINMEGSIAGTATKVEFTGANTATPITDYGANDQIVLDNLPSGSGTSYQDSYNTATGVLTVTEYSGGTSIGSDTITVTGAPGTTIAPTGSFLEISGTGGPTIVLGSSSLGTGGSIYIDNGESYTLSNTSAVDFIPVTFGPDGTSLALNTLDLNDTVSGTANPYQGVISDFGLNDDIILSSSVLPTQILGGQDVLSYAGSNLTITQYNASGVSIGSTTLDVGTGYTAGEFVALLGSNGVNIETTLTAAETPLTFSVASGTANFETTTDYAGGLAPGSSIVTGETVIIASGTAAVSTTAPITDSGTIIVSGASSGFLDMGTLYGAGTIIAESGAAVTLATASGAVDFGAAAAGTPNEIDLDGSATGFTGTIGGFGANDEIVLGTSVLAPGGAGTSYTDSYNTGNGVLTVSEVNAAGATVGTTSFTVANTGGTLTSGAFVDISGPNGVTIALASSTLGNSGSIFIDHGEQVTLANTAGVDSIPVTFGANGAVGGLNMLVLDGTVASTNSPYTGPITGFGLNDDIVLGSSVLPSVASGDTVTLSYSGSDLIVTELNSLGVAIGATTLDVGSGYAANSFVALLGADGVNIETPQTVQEQSFAIQAPGNGNYDADFEDPTRYAGGLAPGATIIAGETVTVVEPTQANLYSSLTNNGTIVLNDPNVNMDAFAAIGGNGTIEVGSDSQLTLANTSGVTTDTIAFGSVGAANNYLVLDGTGTTSFEGTITGMGANDIIDIGNSFLPTPPSAADISLSYSSTTGVLTISDTVGGMVYTDMLHFAGTVPGTFSDAISNGQIIITDMPCFAAGTRILTPEGERRVEHLAIGDEVLSARDGHAARQIIWVGSRTIDITRHANPEKIIPVLIKAGAFGPGLPERDLRLSPDHALFIGGQLIEAKTLVNGATIIRDRGQKFVTYHHIELASHDVVLAEGLPAETYLDSGNRQNFETDAGPIALHADFAAAAREAACAPLTLDGDIVRRTKQQLLDRAIALGFTRTDAINLVAKTGAELIAPHTDRSGRELMFVLPPNAGEVALLSATGVPAEILADPSDRRVLGAAITGLALITGGARIEIALNGPHRGFHDAEAGHRWTNGHATIALPPYTGRAVLEVTLACQATRWQPPATSRQFLNA
jgi:hypothetical protein